VNLLPNQPDLRERIDLIIARVAVASFAGAPSADVVAG
jgi:hypothetical protein